MDLSAAISARFPGDAVMDGAFANLSFSGSGESARRAGEGANVWGRRAEHSPNMPAYGVTSYDTSATLSPPS